MRSIDYFYTSISPYAYLGHAEIRAVADRFGARLNVRPFNLGGVFEVSGALPLAKRPPVRQRYRLVELQRMSEFRGRELNLHPAFFPADPSLADHAAIAILQSGGDPLDFMERIFGTVWARDGNIADEAVVREALSASGFDPDALLEAARSPAVAEIRAANTQAAIEADVVGAPGYVLDGEPFWGQDRIELLARALEKGRPPFRPG